MPKYFLTLLLGLIATPVFANPFCFARATSYYQQVYCELEKKAQTKSIPPFEEFRRADEIVQYSLLKSLAEKNYIQLPKPTNQKLSSTQEKNESTLKDEPPLKGKSQLAAAKNPQRQSQPTTRYTQSHSGNKSPECALDKAEIICDALRFHLIGNRSNNHLKPNALNEDSLMSLSNYSSSESENAFLLKSYNQYLDKMNDIGLGGVTMTYSKFVYFYHDIQNKGLNFSKRFETMYSFLKKDKASMNASEKINTPAGLGLADCDFISENRWVCDYQGTNFIFESR